MTNLFWLWVFFWVIGFAISCAEIRWQREFDRKEEECRNAPEP